MVTIKKKNKTKIIFISLSMILFIVLYFYISNSNDNSLKKPIFLKNYGYDHGILGKDGFLNLYLVDKKRNGELEKILAETKDIKLSQEFLDVKDWELRRENKYKEAQIYNLLVTFDYKKEGRGCIDSITFESKKGEKNVFSLGKIYFDIFPVEGDELEIKSHTGLAKRLNRYDLKVSATSALELETEIKQEHFNNILREVVITVNDRQVKNEKIKIQAGDVIDIQYHFKGNNDYDVYLFAPKIHYCINNTEKLYIPPSAIYGSPIDGEKLVEVYHRWNK